MGIIYFASCGLSDDVVKIGYSDDPEKRIKQLGLPDVELIAIFPGDITQETKLHRRFKHLRLGNSEWFKLDHELRILITSLQRQHQIVWTEDEVKEVSNQLISPSELIQLKMEDLMIKLQKDGVLLLALKKRGRKRQDGIQEYDRPFGALIQWPPTSLSFEVDGQRVAIHLERTPESK